MQLFLNSDFSLTFLFYFPESFYRQLLERLAPVLLELNWDSPVMEAHKKKQKTIKDHQKAKCK